MGTFAFPTISFPSSPFIALSLIALALSQSSNAPTPPSGQNFIAVTEDAELPPEYAKAFQLPNANTVKVTPTTKPMEFALLYNITLKFLVDFGNKCENKTICFSFGNEICAISMGKSPFRNKPTAYMDVGDVPRNSPLLSSTTVEFTMTETDITMEGQLPVAIESSWTTVDENGKKRVLIGVSTEDVDCDFSVKFNDTSLMLPSDLWPSTTKDENSTAVALLETSSLSLGACIGIAIAGIVIVCGFLAVIGVCLYCHFKPKREADVKKDNAIFVIPDVNVEEHEKQDNLPKDQSQEKDALALKQQETKRDQQNGGNTAAAKKSTKAKSEQEAIPESWRGKPKGYLMSWEIPDLMAGDQQPPLPNTNELHIAKGTTLRNFGIKKENKTNPDYTIVHGDVIGYHGVVVLEDTETKERYEARYEHDKCPCRRLKNASRVAKYEKVTDTATSIWPVHLYFEDSQRKLTWLLMRERGPRLQQKIHNRTLDHKTACYLARDTFGRINTACELLNMIHNDISPQAFCFDGNWRLLMTDFDIGLELCRETGVPWRDGHKTVVNFVPFCGTFLYASRAAHRREERYRCHQYESWFYMACSFFAPKSLTWRGIIDHKDTADLKDVYLKTFPEVRKHHPSIPKEFEGIAIDIFFLVDNGKNRNQFSLKRIIDEMYKISQKNRPKVTPWPWAEVDKDEVANIVEVCEADATDNLPRAQRKAKNPQEAPPPEETREDADEPQLKTCEGSESVKPQKTQSSASQQLDKTQD